MKHKFIVLALLGLAWLLPPGAAIPAPALLAAPPTERVPNSTATSSYPRWLPWVSIEPATNMDTGEVDSLRTQYAGLAIDSKNIVHALTSNGDNFPVAAQVRIQSGKSMSIAYKSSRYDMRRAYGFSGPILLDSTQANLAAKAIPAQYVSNADIAVDGNDCVHAVWAHTWDPYTANSVSYPARSEIFYAKSPPGGWPVQNDALSAAISLTPHPDPSLKGFQYSNPRIKAGSDGIARIVCVQENQNTPLDQYSRPLGNKKLTYITVNGGVPSLSTISGAWTDGTCLPKIALNAANVPQIIWTATYVDTLNTPPLSGHFTQAFYSNGPGAGGLVGGTATIQGISTIAQDVTVDLQGNVHYMWITQQSSSTGWGDGMGITALGSISHFSTNLGTSVLSAGATGGGVITDSRNQVHAFWRTAGALNYGARVNNPGPGLNGTWDLQTPALAAPVGAAQDPYVYALAIAKNDQIHLTGARHYTRTMDYNLGRAGGSSMTGLFPGGALNVTSGNVNFQLPLFTGKTTGFSMTPSLIYNSQDCYPSQIAPGWRFNFEMTLTDHMMAFQTPDEIMTLQLGDGRTIVFRYDSAHGYLVPDPEFNFPARIERTGSYGMSSRMTTKSGEIYQFSTNGRLTWVRDLLGNRLDFTYGLNSTTGAILLAVVNNTLVSGGGWSFGITPEASASGMTQRPLIISDPINNQYTLAYTGNQLSSVTFTSGPSTPTYAFTYGAAHAPATQERLEVLKTVQLPRGQSWSLKYGPDGRLAEMDDPLEVYLLDGEADTAAPAAHIAKVLVEYTEPRPASGARLAKVTDRRGFDTRYTVESRRSLVKMIEDPAVLAATPSITPVILAYDVYGNLIDIQDRWGMHTSYFFESVSEPEYVHDNVIQIRRPKASGTGQDIVTSLTYTTDGLSNVATQTTYATPTEGSAVVGRTTTYTYNSLGQLIQLQLPDVQLPDNTSQTNVFRTFAYDGPAGQISRSTDEEGHETIYSQWNPFNGFPGYVWREGGDQGTSFSYDYLGNLQQQLEPQGSAANDAPLPTTYVRDNLYRVTSVSDAAGQVTTYAYDVDSNVVSVTPPAGGATATTTDLRGFVSGRTGPDGTSAVFVDANGNPRRTRDLRGIESNVTMDFMARTTESRSPGASTVTGGTGGGGAAIEKIQFAYDQHDTSGYFSTQTLVGTTSNRVTKTIYDSRARVKQVNAPDGVTQDQMFYDELDHHIGSQTLYSNAVQTCSVQFLDARDRVYRNRTQDGPYGGTFANQSNTYTLYNRTGHVIKSVDPLGSVTGGGYAHKMTYQLDARDRITAVIDGKGTIVQQNVYGDDNRLIQVLGPDPASKTAALVIRKSLAYTSRKELKSALDGQNKGWRYTYNALPGQVDTAADALNRVAQTLYDPTTQRPTAHIEALGTPDETRTLSTWTAGLLTATTVWNPATQSYDATYSHSYDQAGRLEKYAAPAVSQVQQIAPEQYFYNEFGELSRKVAGNKAVSHAYNPLGQITTSAWSGAYSESVTRTYNGLRMQTSISDGTHRRSMDYLLWQRTPRNETFTIGGANWKVQSHGFDAASNYTGLTDGEGKAHAWPVDENNRPTETRYNGQGVKSISYTPAGLLDTETAKDASGNPIAVTTHLYDSLGRRITSRSVKSTTGETLTEYGWDYDAAHQINAIHVHHLATDYTIATDGKGRVSNEGTPGNSNGTLIPPFANPAFGPLPAGNESTPTTDAQGVPRTLMPVAQRSASYSYQAAGNRKSSTINGVTITYVYNAANQLVSESSTGRSVTHVYDQWGNETIRTTTQGAATTTERYAYNYLNQMSGYTNSTTGANWQYAYWPDGDRYAKTNVTSGASELYVPRFGDVATEYTQTGAATPALENTYVQGLGVDSKSTRISTANVRRHFLTNHVGTLGMTLDDLGSTVETNVRDAWGLQTAGSTTERFGALGQRESDFESGLVYIRNRMYDPALGRFTQTDPLLGRRAFAHYAYASNNPLSFIDPWGLKDDPTYFTQGVQANADYNKANNPGSALEQVNKKKWDNSPAANLHQDRIDDYASDIYDMIQNKRDPALILAKAEKLEALLAGDIEKHDRLLYEENLSSAIMYLRSIVDMGGNLAAGDTTNKLAPYLDRLMSAAVKLLRRPAVSAPVKPPSGEPRLLENLKEVDTDGHVFGHKVDNGGIRRVMSDGKVGKFTGKVDFIVTEKDTLLVGEKHSHLSGGAKVKFAGQLIFNNKGQLIGINNASGHYQPNEFYMEPALMNLKAKGVDVSNVKIWTEPAFQVAPAQK